MARVFGARFQKTKFLPMAVGSNFKSNFPSNFKGEVSLYVNATPLGMAGFSGAPTLPARLTPGASGFDLIYRPLETPFIQTMERNGLRAIGGLDMLVWQAMAAWEIWVGKIPSSRKLALKRSVKKSLEKLL